MLFRSKAVPSKNESRRSRLVYISDEVEERSARRCDTRWCWGVEQQMHRVHRSFRYIFIASHNLLSWNGHWSIVNSTIHPGRKIGDVVDLEVLEKPDIFGLDWGTGDGNDVGRMD